MVMSAHDLNTLRTLAGSYAEIANLDIQKERLNRYYKTNALEQVRPVLLIDEVPWEEIDDPMLQNVCSSQFSWLETCLRRTIYQARHFPVDKAVLPIFKVGRVIGSTGIGLAVDEAVLQADTGSNIMSHAYADQLQNEEDLAKLQIPEISYDEAATQAQLEAARQVFDGLLDVTLSGIQLHFNIWDDISCYRGVENILLDLVLRPDFMHQTAQRFAEIAEGIFQQYEDLGLLDADPLLIHCTVAPSSELCDQEHAGKVGRKNTWGRCAAQIFGEVSPEMHDEFDLTYNQKLFAECGLVYYGCCEPLDKKIDILRNRFANLRKISISPWADAENAAKSIRGDYVLAAKPNPAFVAMPNFNPAPVEEEIAQHCRSCKEHNTPLEFVLKDISTIANNPKNLSDWAETATRTIDRFYK